MYSTSPRSRAPSFRACLQAARGGDHEALGALLERCRPELTRRADRAIPKDLRRKADGDDVVQETFLKAGLRLHRFEGNTRAEFRAWLSRRLEQNLYKFRRRFHGCKKRDARREVSLDGGNPEASGASSPTARAPSPDEELSRRETAAAIEQAVEGLPEPAGAVFRLRQEDGRSYGEIGGGLGKSAEAARKLGERACQRLARKLNR